MAQYAGYFDDHVPFVQGPFILTVSPFGKGLRVETKRGNSDEPSMPVHPHESIGQIIRDEFNVQTFAWEGTWNRDRMEQIVDELNARAKDGRLVYDPETRLWRVPVNV
jgi:hypothetical protein